MHNVQITHFFTCTCLIFQEIIFTFFMVGVVLLLLKPGDYRLWKSVFYFHPMSKGKNLVRLGGSFSSLVNAYCLTFIQFFGFWPSLDLNCGFCRSFRTCWSGFFCIRPLCLSENFANISSYWWPNQFKDLYLTLLSRLPDILASLQISCRLCNFELTGN